MPRCLDDRALLLIAHRDGPADKVLGGHGNDREHSPASANIFPFLTLRILSIRSYSQQPYAKHFLVFASLLNGDLSGTRGVVARQGGACPERRTPRSRRSRQSGAAVGRRELLSHLPHSRHPTGWSPTPFQDMISRCDLRPPTPNQALSRTWLSQKANPSIKPAFDALVFSILLLGGTTTRCPNQDNTALCAVRGQLTASRFHLRPHCRGLVMRLD